MDKYVYKVKANTRCNLGQVMVMILVLVILVALVIKEGGSSENESKSKENNIADSTFTDVKVTIRAENPKFDPDKIIAGGTLEMQEAIKEALATAEDIEVKIEAETTEEAPSPKDNTIYYTDGDVIMLAKLLTREAGAVDSVTEQSGVIWTVLNRVESDYYPNTISEVVTQPWQFEGWHPETVPYDECLELTRDVLERWNSEMNGEENVGRTLPEEYLYFTGDGVHNYFTVSQYGTPYVWGSQLVSPYGN